MQKWILTALPALLAILSMFHDPIQQVVAAHPAIAVVLGALYAILTHLAPSPMTGQNVASSSGSASSGALRVIALLLLPITLLGLVGCSQVTKLFEGGIDRATVEQHLLADARCIAAASQVAMTAMDAGAGSLFGLPPGSKIDAASVLSAVVSGKMTAPAALYNSCYDVLVNVGADIVAIQKRMNQPASPAPPNPAPGSPGK